MQVYGTHEVHIKKLKLIQQEETNSQLSLSSEPI